MEINHDSIYILAVAIIVLIALLESLNKKNNKPANSAGDLDKQARRACNNNERSRTNTSKLSSQSARTNTTKTNVKEQNYSPPNQDNQVVDKIKLPKNEIIDVSDKNDLKRMIIASEILKRKF